LLDGYLVVVQDTRGRYTSEGEWYPFLHESNDGYDTVEWVAALPNSNGKVGMMGGSYVGATQMLAAIAHPPHLAGICPVVTASNYHDGWTYQGGALEQWFDQNWTTQLATNTLWRLIAKDTNALLAAPTLRSHTTPIFNYSRFPQVLSYRPDCALLSRLARAPAYGRILETVVHRGALFRYPSARPAHWRLYDIFLGGSLRNYMDSRLHAGTDAARKGQRLLIQIGGHAGFGRHIGDVEFGDEALKFPSTNVAIDWYDYLFKGTQNEFAVEGGSAAGKPVHIFVMGQNAYARSQIGLRQKNKLTRYFLHSGGSANSLRARRRPFATPPKKEASDKFTYRSGNPVPTIGGSLCCDAEHYEPGPRDPARR